MKKAIATTVVAAALALSLSGCTFGLSKPDAKPAPTTAPSSDTKPDPATDATEEPTANMVECIDGEPVTLAEDAVIVEYTGVCGDVVITGNNVDAKFEQVGNVSIAADYSLLSFGGPALDVTVDGTGNMLFGNAIAAITVGGTYNSVSASEATSVAVSGSNNSIAWVNGPADGIDTGTGNAFTGPIK